MDKTEPLLTFEFADSNGKINPIIFQNPLRVLTAYTKEEVLSCFQMVEEAADNGYYAAGFLTYESAAAFDSAYKVKPAGSMPLLWFGIFENPKNQSLSRTGIFSLTEWKPSVSMDEYQQALLSIKESIEKGITYQTNYTIRLTSQFEGDDLSFFGNLKRGQVSNYCAYIHTGEHSILSASPELFFHLKENKITTKPMKGTINRGKSYVEDRENANWLFQSKKNRAENVMIVDLLRNDLGIIAEPGSVNVSKLFKIEQYPTVYQMTSTITAKIAENIGLIDIFKALFPCGSITGAPKISTMRIIESLETSPREVYCGAIGYITPEKEAIFNVPIRTVWIDRQSGMATYGVGGGITWDSTLEGEYLEIIAKSRVLNEIAVEFQLLESILLENGEYFLLEEHLKRMKYSAQYFDFPYKIETVKETLANVAKEKNDGVFKVRLLLDQEGKSVVEAQPINELNTVSKVMLASEPVDTNDKFLYHKTTNRDVYLKFQSQKSEEIFDVLLWNNEGEITEFTNGNVVLEIEGELWTPLVESGLLAGTFREKVLETGEIREKILTLTDLKNCSKLWFINSIRKWKEVQLISDDVNNMPNAYL